MNLVLLVKLISCRVNLVLLVKLISSISAKINSKLQMLLLISLLSQIFTQFHSTFVFFACFSPLAHLHTEKSFVSFLVFQVQFCYERIVGVSFSPSTLSPPQKKFCCKNAEKRRIIAGNLRTKDNSRITLGRRTGRKFADMYLQLRR